MADLANIEGSNLSNFKASINMFIESSEKESVLDELSKLKEIEEVYETAGEYDIVSIASTPSVEEFREFFHQHILHIKGVKSTIVTVFLKLHKNNEILTPIVNLRMAKKLEK